MTSPNSSNEHEATLLPLATSTIQKSQIKFQNRQRPKSQYHFLTLSNTS
jgi:hypothetical protein